MKVSLVVAGILASSPAFADPAAGTIVFSKTADGPAAAAFKLTDVVFARATLTQSMDAGFAAKNVECVNRFFMWTAEVDGTLASQPDIGDGFYWTKPSDADFTKWSAIEADQLIAASPTPSSMAAKFREVVAPRLAAGDHAVKITVRGQCEDIHNEHKHAYTDDLATGTFKLTVPKGATVDLMPKPGRTDPKVVKEATALLEAQWKPDKVLKIVIVSKDWNVEYTTSAGKRVPTRRTVETVVAAKQTDGCRLFDVRLEQPARSKTTFGPTAIAGTGDSRQVDCALIK